MKFHSVIATLIVVLACFIISTNCILTAPHTRPCENAERFKWLWNLRNNNRCLHIIVENVFIPKCFFDRIFNSKFVIRSHDLNAIKSRNVMSFRRRTNCDNFMILAENTTKVFQIFQETNSTTKRFVPFSQIYLVFPSDSDVKFDQLSLSYIYSNGLFVYVAENASADTFAFPSLRNVLTDKTLHLENPLTTDAIPFYGTYKDHPVLNTKHQKKIFRVSLFSCSPYVVYLPDGGFGGLEYRLLREITKNWTIEHSKCDATEKIRDPYGEVREQVQRHESDLGMCSVWLSERSNTYLDVTSYINNECATFLVAKPNRLNPSTYLYKSISAIVQFSITICLIVVSIFLTIIARIGRKFKEKSKNDLIYVGFSRSLFDTFGMLTVQSLPKCPKECSMKSLLYGWAIVSFLFGMIISTGYTSLLTTPPFSKPIDSVVDFLDNDLVFDTKGKSDLARSFFETGVDLYVKLSKRSINNNGTEVRKRAVETNTLAYFVKILSSGYLADVSRETDPHYKLRLMKTCVFNYYTVVALQKYSPYTQFFRTKIGSLQESGVISYWRSRIVDTSNNYMRPYFEKMEKAEAEPEKISIQDLIAVFWLLLAGHGLASTVLIAENFYIYRKKLNVVVTPEVLIATT